MQELIHRKVQLSEEFLKEFNEVQRLFRDRSYDFDSALNRLTDALLHHYHETGNTTAESEVLKVQNTLSLLRKGFNPVKMEKIQSGKRELFWGFAFSGLESLYSLLLEAYRAEQQKLDEGTELISGLFLSMYQNGVLTDQKIAALNTVEEIGLYWRTLAEQNTTIAGIYKKLRLTLIDEDIFLLTERIIHRLH
ncbi:hypothetical protein [Chryseobacterium sp. MFBS3-17]|uniref:hypothetical protein n=1 Tax=Chryseobacterium sp. MFBS3-17 TaxID=2886689 RepID=UPI001D0F223F|nr:hypothetical protein [Chryseobacterium sp. MFBS3-17]MCC2589584.1 hypothetical protein [Chryseobacterium sp. MFBS3-17]